MWPVFLKFKQQKGTHREKENQYVRVFECVLKQKQTETNKRKSKVVGAIRAQRLWLSGLEGNKISAEAHNSKQQQQKKIIIIADGRELKPKRFAYVPDLIKT